MQWGLVWGDAPFEVHSVFGHLDPCLAALCGNVWFTYHSFLACLVHCRDVSVFLHECVLVSVVCVCVCVCVFVSVCMSVGGVCVCVVKQPASAWAAEPERITHH